MYWYSFKPVDTLFFRDAKPMVMGEDHSVNYIFPPPTHTIEGALRTYFYKKDKNKFKDLIKLGESKGGFSVIGPFFKVDNKLYFPAPYSWFYDKSEEDKEEKRIYKIYRLNEKETNLIKIPSKEIYWVKSENEELKTCGGFWISYEDFISHKNKVGLKSVGYFFEEENRVGTGLKERVVRKGHIYSFTHLRLKENVYIVFAVDKKLPIEDNSILTLGAEQRFGLIKKLKDTYTFNQESDSNFYMSLSIIETKGKNNNVISTGKIIYLGGWDLNKGFHKPMRGFFPQGTVFNKKFENCIPIN